MFNFFISSLSVMLLLYYYALYSPLVCRNESKISRKLIDCINTYLLKDGPNLGCQSLEIHHAVQPFIFQCWSTIHDCGVKILFLMHYVVIYDSINFVHDLTVLALSMAGFTYFVRKVTTEFDKRCCR